jgi:hypothetical protein
VVYCIYFSSITKYRLDKLQHMFVKVELKKRHGEGENKFFNIQRFL